MLDFRLRVFFLFKPGQEPVLIPIDSFSSCIFMVSIWSVFYLSTLWLLLDFLSEETVLAVHEEDPSTFVLHCYQGSAVGCTKYGYGSFRWSWAMLETKGRNAIHS